MDKKHYNRRPQSGRGGMFTILARELVYWVVFLYFGGSAQCMKKDKDLCFVPYPVIVVT
jgi:hypothetical protein